MDELVEECLQLNNSEDILDFAEDTDAFDYLGSIIKIADYDELWETEVNSTKKTTVEVDPPLHIQAETISANEDQKQIRAENLFRTIKSRTAFYPDPSLVQDKSTIQVSQLDPKASNDNSSSLPLPLELKPFPSHLKYAYLDTEQQLPIIIANNLRQE
ncbi:hypothetical protein CR513_14710, partial [Mucuna pruriens]